MASLFSPLLHLPCLLSFLSSFWLNKLASLMSDDTSRSQSQWPDNKMAVTLCLSTICVCLFSALPSLALVVNRETVRCCFSRGFVSDHWLFTADLHSQSAQQRFYIFSQASLWSIMLFFYYIFNAYCFPLILYHSCVWFLLYVSSVQCHLLQIISISTFYSITQCDMLLYIYFKFPVIRCLLCDKPVIYQKAGHIVRTHES